jgi:abortive infection bacteriophage resistance protein
MSFTIVLILLVQILVGLKLNKVYEIDAGSIEQYFTGIRNQKIVRNLIAHQNGIARPDQIKKITL